MVTDVSVSKHMKPQRFESEAQINLPSVYLIHSILPARAGGVFSADESSNCKLHRFSLCTDATDLFSVFKTALKQASLLVKFNRTEAFSLAKGKKPGDIGNLSGRQNVDSGLPLASLSLPNFSEDHETGSARTSTRLKGLF